MKSKEIYIWAHVLILHTVIIKIVVTYMIKVVITGVT